MKVVIQRVKEASVNINNEEYSRINEGLLVLVGFTHKDTKDDIDYIVKKIVNLRIFDDANGVMNLSVKDTNKEILSVSQFTLYASCQKGNRPSYSNAMDNIEAKKLYTIFNNKLKMEVPKVKTGVFRENMEVSLINDGPVTIIIER